MLLVERFQFLFYLLLSVQALTLIFLLTLNAGSDLNNMITTETMMIWRFVMFFHINRLHALIFWWNGTFFFFWVSGGMVLAWVSIVFEI